MQFGINNIINIYNKGYLVRYIINKYAIFLLNRNYVLHFIVQGFTQIIH